MGARHGDTLFRVERSVRDQHLMCSLGQHGLGESPEMSRGLAGRTVTALASSACTVLIRAYTTNTLSID